MSWLIGVLSQLVLITVRTAMVACTIYILTAWALALYPIAAMPVFLFFFIAALIIQISFWPNVLDNIDAEELSHSFFTLGFRCFSLLVIGFTVFRLFA